MAMQNVFVVAQPGRERTYFALHYVSPLTRVSKASVMAFTREEQARRVARSIEKFRETHGEFPSREFLRKPKELSWVLATTESPHDLEVVKMPVKEAVGMLLGSGVNLTIVDDPRNLGKATDVSMQFDKASTCARLERVLRMSK